jgi:hypothetical protein
MLPAPFIRGWLPQSSRHSPGRRGVCHPAAIAKSAPDLAKGLKIAAVSHKNREIASSENSTLDTAGISTRTVSREAGKQG